VVCDNMAQLLSHFKSGLDFERLTRMLLPFENRTGIQMSKIFPLSLIVFPSWYLNGWPSPEIKWRVPFHNRKLNFVVFKLLWFRQPGILVLGTFTVLSYLFILWVVNKNLCNSLLKLFIVVILVVIQGSKYPISMVFKWFKPFCV
jgi:hypothetical protein